MINLISRKEGIMSEYRNLMPSIKKEKEKQNKKIEIRVAILRGKTKKDNQSKHRVYQELYNREFNRLYSKLKEIKFENENLDEIIKGYIQYLIQNQYGFDYIELRKYRKGVLKTIIQCAKEYGLTVEEAKYYVDECTASSDNDDNEEEFGDAFDDDEEEYGISLWLR